jgi:hypothetical protein
MELREECIGSIVTAKADNGMTITQTIVNDKKMFKFYKDLGLDVFKSKKKKSESTEGND